jgi:hypothetical protein
MPMSAPLLLSLLLFSPAGVAAQAQATGLQAKLDARVSEYSLSANGLADAILRIAKQFGLPVGIEWVKDKEALRSVSLTWEGDTVRDIVTAAVREYPGYAFRVEHGAVHVFRPDLVNDRHNFLNLRVPDFFEVHQEEGGFANWRLGAVVQNIVSPRNLPPGAGESGDYASGAHEKPVTVTLRGLTVRQALENLANASEHKVWVVTFSDGPALTPTGFRRTETLWHPTPLPDSQQPMWDFLAREQYPLPPVTARPPSH